MFAHPDASSSSQAAGQRASFDYDAFISYDHHDRPVAAGIQKGLHRIGRRMGRLHALRVFRDATDLTASPDLWGKVIDAMDRVAVPDRGALSGRGGLEMGQQGGRPLAAATRARINCCSSSPAGG